MFEVCVTKWFDLRVYKCLNCSSSNKVITSIQKTYRSHIGSFHITFKSSLELLHFLNILTIFFHRTCPSALHHNFKAVPGELSNKFAVLDNPHETDYITQGQMSKCRLLF